MRKLHVLRHEQGKPTDALSFYYKQGFLPLSKTDEGADTRLLYFDLESVKETK